MSRAQIGALLNQAIRLQESGEAGRAEQVCREVLAVDAGLADAWHLLAVTLYHQQRFDDAAQAVKRATSLGQRIAPYWVTRGNIAAACGGEEQAQTSFRRAIKLDPAVAEAHYGLAHSYHREGRLPDAIAAFRSALNLAPGTAAIHFYLARALAHAGRPDEALPEYAAAFAGDPHGHFDRRECLECFRHAGRVEPQAFWHAELIRFFRRGDVDKSRYAIAGLRVLMARPAFRAIQAATERREERFEPDAAALDEVVRDELFLILLSDTVIAQPETELVLTRLRAAILLDEGLRARIPLDFLCGLALQCFNNEFVFAEEAVENEAVGRIESGLGLAANAGGAPDERLARDIAVLAMYRSLHEVAGIEALARREGAAPAFHLLLRRAVSNVLAERRLRSDTSVLGPITDAVSRAVRAQYEENPYPRWLSFDRRPVMAAGNWIESEVPGASRPAAPASPLRILVAGCGSGVETLGLATTIAGVRITAVDLSLSSLAYARRMAGELGVANVEFRQGDLLGPGELREQFDVVYCVGVLVALRDPWEGLRSLLGRVRPGGLVKLGLYSERARSAVRLARDMIRERQLPATAQAIREFRQVVHAAEPQSPLRSLLRWRDFYTVSECRDFLFHVQEHRFRLPQVAAALREHGLTVLGMSKQLPRAAQDAWRQTFPREPVGADLQMWDAVEARHPETFIGMYQIWCRAPGEESVADTSIGL